MTITNLLCDMSLYTLEQLCSFLAYFLDDPRQWFSLHNNTRDEKQQQQKHIRFKNPNLKKDAVSSIYPRSLHIVVT